MWNSIRIETPFLLSKEIKLNFYKNFEKNHEKCQQNIDVISVFGRNGSGKTTIANALQKSSSNEEQTDDESVTFMNVDLDGNKNGEQFKIDENIFVYSQNFIDDNIKVKEDESLNAIIRLRDQDDLQEKYDEINSDLSEITNQIQNKQIDLENYKVGNSGPDYILKKIKDNLKLAGKWSDNAQRIDGGKVKKKVTDQVITKIRNTNLDKDDNVKELSMMLDGKLHQIETIRKKEKLTKITRFENLNNTSNLEKILLKKLKKPNLDEYKKKIISETSVSNQERIDIFTNKDITHCPTCIRDITDEEKERIVEASLSIIETINSEEFTDEIKNAKLYKLKLVEENADYSIFFELIKQLNNYIRSFNKCVDSWQKCLDMKKENIYTVVKPPLESLDSIFTNINNVWLKINNEIDKYNEPFSQLKKIQKEAKVLNEKIASIEMKTDYSQLLKAKKNVELLDKNLCEIKDNKKDLEEELAQIKLKMKGQEIALSEINQMLSTIFMDKSRLSLKPGENCYQVLSRNEPIKLKKLSTGEQNAISLCYFFSTINMNQSVANAYKEKSLVVLDDPISSFDFETKIGMLSLISNQLRKIILTNRKSRVLLLTHDIEILNQLNKIISDIEEYRKNTSKDSNEKKVIYATYSIKNKELKNIEKLQKNQYKEQLQSIYLYAENDDESMDNGIGNCMRRVLEGFATFSYCSNSRSIFNDPEVLSYLGDERSQDFYKSFMSRLVLDGESHNEDRMYSITDSNWESLIDHEEMVKTAKLLILFLYKVNRLHVLKNLKGMSHWKQDKIVSTINSWEELVS